MGSSLRSLAGAPYHLISGIAYALRRGARRIADEQAVADAAWSRSRTDLPRGLELEWLGTAGFRLSYEGHDLLIDPYLTRIPFRDFVARHRVAPAPLQSLGTPRASAILVGHTHFDHAMDVPALARAADCPAYGSESLARLMALEGEAERAVAVEPHRDYEIGPFRFHFVPSLHSKLALGLWTPSDGDLSCEHLDELTPQAYRCGQVWGIHIAVGGVTFYHQGSCDLIEGEIRDKGVDFLLAGIAGRRYTPRYVERILRALDPRVIVPHHWDDFFRPLDVITASADRAPDSSVAGPARALACGFSMNVNVDAFFDEVHAVTRDVEIRTLRPFEAVRS
jgi:L-ascorbate metabolism protein UlaG (beta-lactamase superfamily)